MTGSPVARLVAVLLDCADPQRLADFYRALLGGRQLWAKESSVGVEVPGAALGVGVAPPYQGV